MHTLVFLSSDGGAYGGYGAERFARTSPLRGSVKAVVSLDGLAGSARAARSSSPASGRARPPRPSCGRSTSAWRPSSGGRRPAPAGSSSSSTSAMPFGYGEQAPFLAREISAIRLATAARRQARTPRRTSRHSSTRPGSRGSAVPSTSILASLDGGIELVGRNRRARLPRRAGSSAAGRSSSSSSSPLVPFLAGAIDLFARCRRRRLPLAAAWRALRVRLGVWLWCGLLVGLGALAGVFPRGAAIPPPPDSPAVTDWPVAGLARDRRARRSSAGGARAASLSAVRACADDEALAGYAVALVALGAVAVATALVSPYGLVFVAPVALRLAVAAAGGARSAGPATSSTAPASPGPSLGRRRDRHPARARASTPPCTSSR